MLKDASQTWSYYEFIHVLTRVHILMGERTSDAIKMVVCVTLSMNENSFLGFTQS